MNQYNPAALPEGGIFHGRYQIVRCIKAGGMGAVYEVVHIETRRRRALKVMLPIMVASAEMRERFKLEARIAADIESDHIVETFDAGVDPDTGAPFLVMELLRGEDLGAVLARRGRLPADETVQILAQAAKALDKTHAAGIVHRDLKPDNLFLARRDDDPPRLKILDFGIAKVVAEATEATAGDTRSVVGTPIYMAPEQVRGNRISPATDLYALGHIAYQLLVGEAYFAEERGLAGGAIYPILLCVGQGVEEPAAARARRRKQVTLPPELDAWFERATALDPTARFEQASAMVVALATALGVTAPANRVPPTEGHAGAGSLPAPPVLPGEMASVSGAPGTSAPFTSDPSAPPPPRSRELALSIAAGVLAAGVVVAVAMMRTPPVPRDPGVVAAQPPAPPVTVAPAPATALPVLKPVPASAGGANSSSPIAHPAATVPARLPARPSSAPSASAMPPSTPRDLGF